MLGVNDKIQEQIIHVAQRFILANNLSGCLIYLRQKGVKLFCMLQDEHSILGALCVV